MLKGCHNFPRQEIKLVVTFSTGWPQTRMKLHFCEAMEVWEGLSWMWHLIYYFFFFYYPLLLQLEWNGFGIVWQDKLFCLWPVDKNLCWKTKLILGLDRIGLESWISRSRRSVLLSINFSKTIYFFKTKTNQNLKVLSRLRPIPCIKRYRLEFQTKSNWTL